MSLLLRFVKPFYLAYAYILFVAGLLIVFPFVLLSLLPGQPTAGNIVLGLCRGWSYGWTFLIGIRH
ncbi:MAG TPA: hypothetical protein VK907_07905, partial [Phnomibacter sp.]|nr:hypothetical protein [Phnomibacter sp.]